MPTPLVRSRRAAVGRARLLRAAFVLSAILLGASAHAQGASPSGTSTSGAPAAAASVCGGASSCTEVSAFAMSVVEFRATLQGGWKILTTTLRFRNKLNRPLVLGYVVGSGGATDDRGNRYLVKDQDVRGIGLISQRADDKFVIAPGDTGDARFTLVWGGQGIYGSTFDLDLTVREITQVGNGQTTLGSEYPLQIVGLVDGARSAGPGVAQASEAAPAAGSAPATGAASPTAAAQPAPGGAPPAQTGTTSPLGFPAPAASAHCAAGTSCQDLGTFTVTMNQAAAAVSGKTQLVRVSVRVKNQTNQPLVLAYKAGTGRAVDEQGNAFTWGKPGTHDGSALGIGTVEGAKTDAQFQVAPGATRDAQLVLTRDAGPRPPGRNFTVDAVLVEQRAAAGGQWQKGREYPVHLGAASAAAAAVPAVGQTPAGQNPANDHVQQATDLLKGLLGGK
ncbi:MAG TPA: hypothetical protein VFF12_13145 [Myxococcaceae bacterium]|nr:hypothetical protein [Myxococcaceae bacterium]